MRAFYKKWPSTKTFNLYYHPPGVAHMKLYRRAKLKDDQ